MDLSALGFDTIETLRAEGSTEVYRCIQRADDKPVVVKVIPPSLRTPLTEARLRYEFNIARTAGANNATGIMRPLHLIATETHFALVSQDTGGYALSHFGSNNKWLDLEEVLRVAIGAAETLTLIHRAGVVHKDINAQNIVFNRKSGAVEIIDFGISAQVPRERPNLDPSGKPQGTLSYMSPEQTGRTSHLLDYRTDFYSLGVTLYYLITKHIPFLQTNRISSPTTYRTCCRQWCSS
jgi:histidine kinase